MSKAINLSVPHALIAAKYGKPLMAYEVGQSLTGAGDFPLKVCEMSDPRLIGGWQGLWFRV